MRNSDIASLFEKHATKKAADVAATSNSCSNPVEPVVGEQTRERVIEKIVNPKPPPPPPPPQPSSLPPVYDIDCLPHDPGERQPAQERYIGFKNPKVYYSCIHK